MVDKVSNFRANNLYYRHTLPWKFNPNDKEKFEPQEFKWGNEKIVAKDLFDYPTPKLLKQFGKEWINKIETADDDTVNQYKIGLIKNGYLFNQLDLIIKLSRGNTFRAATWSKANEIIGKKASNFAFLSLVVGVVKQLFFNHDGEIDNFEPTNLRSYVPKTFHILNSLFRSQRNLHQYTMYSLPDDDAAMNVYQADVYGNKIGGGLAEMSTFMETKINPVLFPLSEFLPKNLGEYFRKLAVLPASLWWRARMPAYINQEFFTDFLKYIWHKPMSFLGNEYSTWQLSEIEKRGNLKWEYFVGRHKENLGISNKRYEIATSNPADSPRNDKAISLARRLVGTLAQMFHNNPKKQTESAKRLGEFVAPVLGMYGFFTSALGNTSNAICKLFNIENTFSKISNLIQATSIYSQQLIYLPKIMIPFLSETRMIGKLISDSNVKEEEDAEKIEQLKDLYKKRQVISSVGIGSFLLHTVNIIGKGMGGKMANLIDEVACNLTNIFFSNRRHLMGMQFRIENPEFID